MTRLTLAINSDREITGLLLVKYKEKVTKVPKSSICAICLARPALVLEHGFQSRVITLPGQARYPGKQRGESASDQVHIKRKINVP